MDFSKLVLQRESCRSYAEQPVEKEKLIECLKAARLAPSANNSQPWHFTVANSPELSPKVAKLTQQMGTNRFTEKAPAFVVVSEDKAHRPMLTKIGAGIKHQDFTSVDIGIAAAHLCFAATEQGLSTCILGWFDEKGLKRLLGIPASTRIRLVVAVGYAATDTLRQKTRRPLEESMDYIGL